MENRKNFRPITHVIFDMDGLLLDTEGVYDKIIQKIAARYDKIYTHEIQLKVLGTPEKDTARIVVEEAKLPITPEEFLVIYHEMCPEELAHPELMPDSETVYFRIYEKVAKMYGKTYTIAIREKLMGVPERAGAEIFCKELGIDMTAEQFLDVVHPICRDELTKPDLMPGVDRLVRHLSKHKVPLAIATSGSDWMSKIKTQNYPELFSLFHHSVYGSSDPAVKHGKPAPDIYLICAARFPDNPPPEKVLVFEDAPNGVEGAVRAGMQVVMVPAPETEEKYRKNATLVLKSLADFEPSLFGLPPYDN